MKEQLEHYIHLSLKNPNKEEIDAILNLFELKEYVKGDYFKKHNTICNQLGFIVEGCARHYAINDNGDEVTGRVTQKNNFITEIVSLRTKERTPVAIDILEPSKILIANYSDVDLELQTNLTLNWILREHMADNIVEVAKLRLLFLTGSAKDRYRFILENNPSLLKNFPLRFIASMIGITPTQLSRIRKKRDS